MAIRVVFGALVTWVPWTAIRFVVCWSVPLVLHGEQPDVFTDPPYNPFLLFPFLVELIIPAWYFLGGFCDDKLDVDGIEPHEIESITQHDILALRYRLMRPGIVTFAAHFILMPFSPASGMLFSWIPWALSFFWWERHFPAYAMKPHDKPGFFARLERTLPTGRGKPRMSSEEAQEWLDSRPRYWNTWFGR